MTEESKRKGLIYRGIQMTNVNFIAGLATGITTTGLYNPWDRAIYLSVKNQTSFLKELFSGNPYHGFSQAVVQRTFSGMLYFAFAGQIRSTLDGYPLTQNLSPEQKNFIIGTSAGVLNGFILNQLSVVKYHTWGNENRRFIHSSREIITKGGVKTLFKGVGATITRDVTFGIVYEVLRFKCMRLNLIANDEANQLFCNLTGAGLATVVSGPFNFARNIKYSIPPGVKPPSTFHCVYQLLFVNAFKTPNPLSYLQARMRIGWGTARVAVGMATAQFLFDYVKDYLQTHYK